MALELMSLVVSRLGLSTLPMSYSSRRSPCRCSHSHPQAVGTKEAAAPSLPPPISAP